MSIDAVEYTPQMSNEMKKPLPPTSPRNVKSPRDAAGKSGTVDASVKQDSPRQSSGRVEEFKARVAEQKIEDEMLVEYEKLFASQNGPTALDRLVEKYPSEDRRSAQRLIARAMLRRDDE